MTEDAPPADMNGTDENPDAPQDVDERRPTAVVAPADEAARRGYPIEEALRPITLPQNMSEVSIDAAHAGLAVSRRPTRSTRATASRARSSSA